uniref:Transmembrane protein n=1 Tax=Pithovirus LCPAC201 TaxID=2506591 RepID=A0A481Z5U3_9VIRU|nr:MAG: hypothetical protein LCPAC201_02670 [Pithovirus LCPAC201]
MDKSKYSYSASGSGTGKEMDMSNSKGTGASNGKGYGRGWGAGAIIVIIIVIIIIIIIIWWFVTRKNRFDSCADLAGTRWKGEGIYSGSKRNSNLQDDCHQEWVDLKFLKGHGKCVRVEVNFKIFTHRKHKSVTKAAGSFRAHGVMKDGIITLVSESINGKITLEIHDEHSLSYTFIDLDDARGIGENGVTHAFLTRVVKHDY